MAASSSSSSPATMLLLRSLGSCCGGATAAAKAAAVVMTETPSAAALFRRTLLSGGRRFGVNRQTLAAASSGAAAAPSSSGFFTASTTTTTQKRKTSSPRGCCCCLAVTEAASAAAVFSASSPSTPSVPPSPIPPPSSNSLHLSSRAFSHPALLSRAAPPPPSRGGVVGGDSGREAEAAAASSSLSSSSLSSPPLINNIIITTPSSSSSSSPPIITIQRPSMLLGGAAGGGGGGATTMTPGLFSPPLPSLSSSPPGLSSMAGGDRRRRRGLSSSATVFDAGDDGVAAINRAHIEAYHAGLRKTEFTSSLDVVRESQVIPIFRILDSDGQLQKGWESPFSQEEALDKYTFMVRLSIWDDMLYNIQRQGRISFYIQNQGEEALQTGVAAALTVDDHLFCQYRELGVLMWRGFSLDDVLNQCFSNKLEEGKGRQMPISYTKRELNIQTISTPLTTQVPHAAGAGYAFRNAGEKRCSVTFFGEGAASEGDFHAAMNFAATLRSQTMFVCRNNGYAISTPVQDQYAGDGIAIRAAAYGMPTVRVDGNDLFATFLAAQRCRQICVEESTPVCLELMTYRMGHHSTSDDSSQYRPEGELDAWTQSGIHPIARLKKYLLQQGWWSEEQEENIKKEARKTLLQSIKKCEKVQKYPIIPGLFDGVYNETPPHLKEQADQLRSHLEKNSDKYDLTAYESV